MDWEGTPVAPSSSGIIPSPRVDSTDTPIHCAQVAIGSNSGRSGRRTSLLWVLGLTILYLGQSLPRLTAVPRAIMDESWEACTGYALAYEGRLRNPVVQNRSGIDRAFVQPRVTQSFLLAATYRLLGFSLASGRLASVLVGLGAVLGVFCLMRTWLSPGVAGLIALLFAVDSQFFIASRTVRPEVYLLCASVWMLALLTRGTLRPSPLKCFAAGIVGSVGCYTHPNTALVILPAIVLIFYQVGLRRGAITVLTSFALGGIVGVIPFLAYLVYAHIHHHVSFIEQLGSFYTTFGEDVTENPLSRELRRWWTYLRPMQRAPWVLILIVSMIAAVIRRHVVQVWSLVLIVGHVILMALLIKMWSQRYLVVLAPWLAALVVLWAVQLWDRAARTDFTQFGRRTRRALAVGAVVVAIAVQVLGNAYVFHAHRNADYDAVCRRIAQQIPAGARVAGHLALWTGLHEYPYVSEINEPKLMFDLIAPTLRARLSAFAPQYMVRMSDPCWILSGVGPRRKEFNRDVEHTRGYPHWEALENQFRDDYLVQHGATLLDRFTTFDFGTIEVYQLKW